MSPLNQFTRRFRPSLEILEDRLAPAVFTVDIAIDEDDGNTAAGDVSLREAVRLANTTANGVVADEIHFSAAVNGSLGGAHIELTLGELLISDSVKIIGNGRANTIIDANGDSRIFRMDDGSALSTIDVELQALFLLDGSTTGDGGAILHTENLTIRDCEINDHHAQDNGGGIYMFAGAMSIFDSTIFDCAADGDGGGIYIQDGAVSINNTILQSNETSPSTGDDGGAIYVEDGAVGLVDCSVLSNRTGANSRGDGGAVYVETGAVSFRSTTFEGNNADGNGGAVYVEIAAVGAFNSTFSGNWAKNNGGAYYIEAAAVSFFNATVTINQADRDGAAPNGTGGGLFVEIGTVVLRNTLVAGNFAGAVPNTTPDDIKGSVTALFSLIGINTGASIGGNDNQIGSVTPINPLLGALADNGGPTKTHALAENSPAKDKGNNDLAALLATDKDQRGFARIFNGTVDIGAFELGDETAATQDLYAVGADAGALPHVRVFNADGSPRFSFLAYGAGFRGGVRVATGDVTGDGIDDIITGAGPGAGPHIKVFNGATGAEIQSYYAFLPTWDGGLFVAAGDVTGDGRADVVVGADAGAGPHVVVFNGVTQALVHSFYAFDFAFKGGVRVAAGDANGDNRADIIAAAGPGAGPHVRSFDSTTLAQIDGFFAYEFGFAGGVYVAAGDFDGDNRADIITGAGPGTGRPVRVFRGTDHAVLRDFVAYPGFQGGVRVAAAERNGDSQLDILTGAGPGAGPHARIFHGVTLADLDSFFAFDPAFLGGIYVG